MIIIEEIKPEHFPLIAQWLSRPETNRWLTSEWRGQKVNPSMIAILVRNRKNRLFVVRSDNAPVGLVGLSDIDVIDKTAMVWCVLGDLNFSGKGLMTEAVSKLAKIAFIDMGLFSLYAWVMEDNIPSTKLFTKVGFNKAGRLRLSANSSGHQVDRIYFDLTYLDSPSNQPP